VTFRGVSLNQTSTLNTGQLLFWGLFDMTTGYNIGPGAPANSNLFFVSPSLPSSSPFVVSRVSAFSTSGTGSVNAAITTYVATDIVHSTAWNITVAYPNASATQITPALSAEVANQVWTMDAMTDVHLELTGSLAMTLAIYVHGYILNPFTWLE